MVRRIFLAINIPKPIKEEIQNLQQTLPELPIRWTAPENLHITLAFIGNMSDKEVEALKTISLEIGKKHGKFSFSFSELTYGPNSREPKMIWLKGQAPKALMDLVKNLEKSLQTSKEFTYIPEKRPWTLHLTLGRLNEFEFRKLDLEERPIIQQEVSFEIPVTSFEIMESELKKGGAEYTICESISLA